MSANDDQGILRSATNASLEFSGEWLMCTNATNSSPTPPAITLAPISVVVISVMLEVLMIPLILLGNGAVVLLVLKNEALRTITNAFMVSLAMADTIQGLTLVLVIVGTLNPVAFNDQYIMCLTLWCTLLLASGCSCLSLFSVTVDRYVKVMHPLTYQQIINKTVAATATAIVWIYTFLLAFVLPFSGLNQIKDTPDFSCLDFTSVFNPVHIQIVVVTNGILPFILMCLMYFRLLMVVLEKLKAECGRNGGTMMAGRWLFMKRELHSVKTFVILLGFTGLAWLPFTTIVLLEVHTSYRASLTLRCVFSWLTFLNSAVNPVVYTIRSEPFRRAASKTCAYRLVRRCCSVCKRKPKITPLNTSRLLITVQKSVANGPPV
ncbi:adenosine receptor A1-like [Acanthaster planci]|uniref:Adenosine receptor A1-like n=1 Tax=Acanthaster planci TaxID=133434 RepID=A0A8B7YYG9_ACAPL|nr:adenosine receptor A1-like [Acanthaster planci]